MPTDKSYDDIINLPHYQSPNRAHMTNYDRAAQFSPFAALTGYDDAVSETARLTDRKIELDEYGLDTFGTGFTSLSAIEHMIRLHGTYHKN